MRCRKWHVSRAQQGVVCYTHMKPAPPVIRIFLGTKRPLVSGLDSAIADIFLAAFLSIATKRANQGFFFNCRVVLFKRRK